MSCVIKVTHIILNIYEYIIINGVISVYFYRFVPIKLNVRHFAY